jgi:Ran GTPase-activating protein (RanGAP) involved in mRNA processing and transport
VPSLLVFEISNQRIGDNTAKAIADLLTEHGCVLETLDLTCCEFTGKGITVICKALSTNQTVKNLRLGWNPLGREGGLAVAEMLQQNTTLESLELCNTSLDTAAIIHLYSVLRDHPSLQNVDLQKSLLYSRQEDTTKHAAQMLCCNTVMNTLNLAHSQVGDLGADVISKALFRNNALRVLCLASNQIGMQEALFCFYSIAIIHIFFSVLFIDMGYVCFCFSLVFLHILSFTGGAGGKAIGSLLKSPDCSLFSLDLSKNRLGDQGGEAIGDALAANTSLKRLNLSSNQMGEDGLSGVAKGMSINSTLRVLLLWGNNFPMDGCAPDSGSCVAALDALLKGRFAHLDVDVDIKSYEVDGMIQISRS